MCLRSMNLLAMLVLLMLAWCLISCGGGTATPGVDPVKSPEPSATEVTRGVSGVDADSGCVQTIRPDLDPVAGSWRVLTEEETAAIEFPDLGPDPEPCGSYLEGVRTPEYQPEAPITLEHRITVARDLFNACEEYTSGIDHQGRRAWMIPNRIVVSYLDELDLAALNSSRAQIADGGVSQLVTSSGFQTDVTGVVPVEIEDDSQEVLAAVERAGESPLLINTDYIPVSLHLMSRYNIVPVVEAYRGTVNFAAFDVPPGQDLGALVEQLLRENSDLIYLIEPDYVMAYQAYEPRWVSGGPDRDQLIDHIGAPGTGIVDATNGPGYWNGGEGYWIFQSNAHKMHSSFGGYFPAASNGEFGYNRRGGVYVIDSGCDLEVPDWAGPTPGWPGNSAFPAIDYDYCFWLGLEAEWDPYRQTSYDIEDFVGHGTMVSGFVSARGENHDGSLYDQSQGTKGILPFGTSYEYLATTPYVPDFAPHYTAIACAILNASETMNNFYEKCSNVVNISSGGLLPTQYIDGTWDETPEWISYQELHSAIEDASDDHIDFVAVFAAGNVTWENPTWDDYEAENWVQGQMAIQHPWHVIAVGARTLNGVGGLEGRADYSVYNGIFGGVAISAPGGSGGQGLLTTCTYADSGPIPYITNSSGTSFAAPIVASVIAATQANYPGWLSDDYIDHVVGTARSWVFNNTSTDLPVFGYDDVDMVDASRAVSWFDIQEPTSATIDPNIAVFSAYGQLCGGVINDAGSGVDARIEFYLAEPGETTPVYFLGRTSRLNGTINGAIQVDLAEITLDVLPNGTYDVYGELNVKPNGIADWESRDLIRPRLRCHSTSITINRDVKEIAFTNPPQPVDPETVIGVGSNITLTSEVETVYPVYEVRYYYDDAEANPHEIGVSPQTEAANGFPVFFDIFAEQYSSPGELRAELWVGMEGGSLTLGNTALINTEIIYPEFLFFSPLQGATVTDDFLMTSGLATSTLMNMPDLAVEYYYDESTTDSYLGTSYDEVNCFPCTFDFYRERLPSQITLRADVWIIDEERRHVYQEPLGTDSVTVNVEYSQISITEPEQGATLTGPADVSVGYTLSPPISRIDILMLDDPVNPTTEVLLNSATAAPYGFTWDVYERRLLDHPYLRAEMYLEDWPEPVSTDTLDVYIDYNESIAIINPTSGSTISGDVKLLVDVDTWRSDRIDFVQYWIEDANDRTSRVCIGEEQDAPYSHWWNVNDGRMYPEQAYLVAELHIADAPSNEYGIYATDEVDLTLDVDPFGLITITSPADGAFVSGNQQVTVDITANMPVTRVRYYVTPRDDPTEEVDLGDGGSPEHGYLWDISAHAYPSWELYLAAELYIEGQAGAISVDTVSVDIDVQWQETVLDTVDPVVSTLGKLALGTDGSGRIHAAWVTRDPAQSYTGERLCYAIETGPGTTVYDTYYLETLPSGSEYMDLSFGTTSGCFGLLYQRYADWGSGLARRLRFSYIDGGLVSFIDDPGSEAYLMNGLLSCGRLEDQSDEWTVFYADNGYYNLARYPFGGSWASSSLMTLPTGATPVINKLDCIDGNLRGLTYRYQSGMSPENSYQLHYCRITAPSSLLERDVPARSGAIAKRWLGTAFCPVASDVDPVFTPLVFNSSYDAWSADSATAGYVGVAEPSGSSFAFSLIEQCGDVGSNFPSRHGYFGKAVYLPVKDQAVMVYHSGNQDSAAFSNDKGDLKAAYQGVVNWQLETIDTTPGGADLALTHYNDNIGVLYLEQAQTQVYQVVLSREYVP